MPSLADLLDHAAGPIAADPMVDDLHRRVRARRRHRRVVGVGLIVGLVVIALVAWPTHETTRRVKTISPGVFPGTTGVVLVASDGYDGATFIDLDHRVAVRRPLDGERAGDQPFRLTRVDDALIVGWGEVHAVPLDGGRSTLLGTDVVYVPAVEPGTVWLYDFLGRTHARQVDLSGRVLHDIALDGAVPIRGVPDGLLLEPNVIVDATTGARRTLGDGRIAVGDVRGPNVLWQVDPGGPTHVTDLATNADRTLPGQASVQTAGGGLSPDGRRAAVHDGGHIEVVDLRTGTVRAAADVTDPYPALAWAPDGHQLFVIDRSYGESVTRLQRYDVETGATDQVVLPFGGANSLIALPASDVTAMLRSPMGSRDTCQPPGVMPSGRTGPCGFRF